MEQYIPKSALVAEIKNLIERAEAERVLHPKTILAAKNYLLIEDYKKLLSFIDSLEVKEVDLEKYYHEFLQKEWFGNSHVRTMSEMIAWLEKQSEHAKFCDSIQVGDKVTRNQDGVLVNLSQLKRVAKPAEKQGEQKPTDKVEPKFKVGDWIVYNDNLYHIGNIALNRYYECLRVDGTVYTFSLDIIDSKSHLWTIQDAKDGDILADKDNNIGIYKEIEGIYWDSYIYLGCDGKLRGFSIGGKHEQPDTHPATKEQRDTLERAMTNAGYSFDFEKKELKKIEQKPNYCHHEVDLSDCSEEYRKAYYDGWNNCNQQHAQLGAEQNPTWSEEKCKEFIGELQSLMFEWSNKKENMGVCIDRHIDKLLSIVSDISDLKPAWSEEDEEMLEGTCRILFNSKECTTSNVRWLKSFKDRVQLQTKQEWSEEDKRILSGLSGLVKDCYLNGGYALPTDEYDEYKKWLKSLKDRTQPQPRQEWSEEDEYYRNIIMYCLNGESVRNANKEKAVLWLKSLRPQSTWKPSDEQLKSLQEVIDAGYYTSYPYTLETLYEELKKLREK